MRRHVQIQSLRKSSVASRSKEATAAQSWEERMEGGATPFLEHREKHA